MANFSKLNIGDRVASSGLRRFRKLSVEQLPSPYGVSLDGDYLSWGDYSCFATSFDILVDGVVKATVSAPTNSFDLSTLGLADGTYSITVVSKADGYLDSDPSEAVSYEVGGDELAGTWVWHDDIYEPNSTTTSIKWKGRVNVSMASGSYNDLSGFQIGNGTILYYRGSSAILNGLPVWTSTKKWTSYPQYRTFTILNENVTVDTSEWSVDEFKGWLKANATKQ